jgi:hypothetical protein
LEEGVREEERKKRKKKEKKKERVVQDQGEGGEQAWNPSGGGTDSGHLSILACPWLERKKEPIEH